MRILKKTRIHHDVINSIVVFIIPFLYLFRYVSANSSHARTIGNDFHVLYYSYKLYLLDALSHLRIPLWSPSEACGFPFYSSPFTQTFYPLNIFLAVFYKIAGGYSYLDHQRFTVLGIAIFAVGIYYWLRSLNVAGRNALFSAVILSMSFKITEIVRFPNAVHTVAWIPYILLGCTLALHKKRRGSFIIFSATVMMLLGGYPYYVYYSMFLIGPYLLLLSIPGTRKLFFDGHDRRFCLKHYWAAAGAAFATALFVCSPYLAKMAQLLSQTVDRGGDDFSYSVAYEFTLSDTVGSLIFPPAAQMEGWYYFGIAALLLILAYSIHSLLYAINNATFNNDALFIVIIFVWWGLISYITYGQYSYLFKLLWHYLPGFSSLRVWGRMNIILLPIIALLLARSHGFFEQFLAHRKVGYGKVHLRLFFLFFITSYGVIFSVQNYFYRNKLFDSYWADSFLPDSPGFHPAFYLCTGLAMFTIMLALLLAYRKKSVRSKNSLTVIALFLIVFTVFDVGKAATQQWSPLGRPSSKRRFLNVEQLNRESLTTHRVYRDRTVSHRAVFAVGILRNWYFERYVNFLTHEAKLRHPELPFRMGSEITHDALRLLGVYDGKRFYLSTSIEHSNAQEFLRDADAYSHNDQLGEIVVEKYTGDELRVNIQTDSDGFFNFIDNWDSDWKATVNGEEVSIQKLFGTFKSVKVEKGTNVVEFKYRPKWL